MEYIITRIIVNTLANLLLKRKINASFNKLTFGGGVNIQVKTRTEDTVQQTHETLKGKLREKKGTVLTRNNK